MRIAVVSCKCLIERVTFLSKSTADVPRQMASNKISLSPIAKINNPLERN